MRESALSKKVQKYLKELQKSGESVFYFKVHGSAMQRAGIPDLMVVYYGTPVFLELKVGKNKPTKLQQHTIEEIRRSGAIAEVCYSLEDCQEVLNNLPGNKKPVDK